MGRADGPSSGADATARRAGSCSVAFNKRTKTEYRWARYGHYTAEDPWVEKVHGWKDSWLVEQVSLESGMKDWQVMEDESVDKKDDELARAIKGNVTETESQ